MKIEIENSVWKFESIFVHMEDEIEFKHKRVFELIEYLNEWFSKRIFFFIFDQTSFYIYKVKQKPLQLHNLKVKLPADIFHNRKYESITLLQLDSARLDATYTQIINFTQLLQCSYITNCL